MEGCTVQSFESTILPRELIYLLIEIEAWKSPGKRKKMKTISTSNPSNVEVEIIG